MEAESSAQAPSVRWRVLRRTAWIIAALFVLAGWAVLFSVLVVATDFLVPVGGPEQAPRWIAFVALAVYSFAWPLLLLVATQRLYELNRALRAVLLFLAAVTFAAAVSEALGYGQQFGLGSIVFYGRTLDTAPAGFTQAALTCLAVLVARRPNKRINPTPCGVGALRAID